MIRHMIRHSGFFVSPSVASSTALKMDALSSIETFHFGENSYLGGGRFGPISQPQLEYVFVQNGAVDVDADGAKNTIIEGYAALVFSYGYLCYDYRKDMNTKVLWCEATLPKFTRDLSFLISAQPIMLPVSRRMLDMQRMGMDLGLQEGEQHNLLSASIGRALFQEYLYQAHLRKREQPIHRSVLRAKNFIEQNISHSCSLDDIANFSNVTPQHLTRIFKRDMGQTPVQYLWTLRAKKGGQMLRRSGLNVAEIAYCCGYENANHFSRHIKEHFGASPTILRKRRWEKSS